jgi:hypothetical protein
MLIKVKNELDVTYETPDGSMANNFGSSFSYEAKMTDTPNGLMAP